MRLATVIVEFRATGAVETAMTAIYKGWCNPELAVAHHLPVIRHAGNIVVLDDEKIVD